MQTKFSETNKALKTVSTGHIRLALKEQLLLAESALQRRNKSASITYLETLVATVLILRKGLTASVVSNLLEGITIDAQNNEIVLPMVVYRSNSRCSRGENCLRSPGTRCVTITGTGGCGTIPLRVQ